MLKLFVLLFTVSLVSSFYSDQNDETEDQKLLREAFKSIRQTALHFIDNNFDEFKVKSDGKESQNKYIENVKDYVMQIQEEIKILSAILKTFFSTTDALVKHEAADDYLSMASIIDMKMNAVNQWIEKRFMYFNHETVLHKIQFIQWDVKYLMKTMQTTNSFFERRSYIIESTVEGIMTRDSLIKNKIDLVVENLKSIVNPPKILGFIPVDTINT